MAITKTVILDVEVGGATTVKELKSQIDQLSVAIAGADKSSAEYATAMQLLQKEQEQLAEATSLNKDATTALEGSYAAIQKQMTSLRKEWKATNDEAQRAELGKQINALNDSLKDMDASIGVYNRNVGNYASAWKGAGDFLKQMPPTLGATKEKLGKVGDTMGLMGKQPILAIIGLLAPIIQKITESLKSNGTAMEAVDKAMAALKPLADVLTGAIQAIANVIQKVVGKFTSLVGESGGAFSKVIAGAVGVGNALLQYMLTPIKTIVSAFKGLGNILKDIFTGQFDKVKEDASNAWNGIKDAFKNGFSFKDNYEKGKEIGEQFLKGMEADKQKAKETGEALGNAVAEGMASTLPKMLDWKKSLADGEKQLDEQRKAEKEDDLELQRQIAEQEKEIDKDVADALASSVVDAGDKMKQRTELMRASVSSAASLLGALGDAIEANSEGNEKAAKVAKALKIGEATINTISGAITAYMSCQSYPQPYGTILGAIQAAIVTATGVANIAKIRSTDVSGSSDSSTSTSFTTSGTSTTPRVATAIPTTGLLTGASQEAQLNQIASNPVKAYIVSSDLEAETKFKESQSEETDF